MSSRSSSTIQRSFGKAFLFFFLILSGGILSDGLLQAQSWNRAVFRGDEIEPRDYDFNEEYFLNLMSYRLAPDWEDLWNESDKSYLLTVGSVRSDEFYIRQELKLHLDVTDGLRFHYDLLQDEDFDTRFLRHRAGLVYAFNETWSGYAFGEGTSLKEDNDVGAGVVFRAGVHDWCELQLTAVDFNEAKGKENRRFRRDAYGALLRNEISLSEKIYIGAGVELQMPMKLIDPGEDVEFRFRKGIYEGWLGWRIGDESRLRFFLSAGDTGKESDYITPPPSDQRLHRNTFRAGAECQWRSRLPLAVGVGREDLAGWRAGCEFFHFRERSLFPDSALLGEIHERDEFTMYGGVSFEMWEKVFLKPALYVDYVSQIERYPKQPVKNDRSSGIQAKLSGMAEIRFSRKVRLVINPNIDLDQMNWGGGNVQFIALF